MDMKKSPVLSNRGSLVREGGVEPPRPHGHTDLNRARLPIPPFLPITPREKNSRGKYNTIFKIMQALT